MNNAKKRQNQAYEESKQPQKKPKKVVWIFLVVLAVLFVVFSIIQQFVPIYQPPVQENSWKNITPGYPITEKLAAELGPPVEVTNLPGEKKRVSYQSSDFKSYYNEVYLDSDNTVEFVKVPLAYNESRTLTEYTSLYGDPDFSLYNSELGFGIKAFVFLDEGVAVIANEKTLVLEGLWYFEPATKEDFLSSWGRDLTPQASYPEAFPGL